jgi:4-hydroxythreonine-4-phosphate dehydrogenase
VTSGNGHALLALTAGEPAGIGPELCIALAQSPLRHSVVVITDPAVLEARARRLDTRLRILPFDDGNATTAIDAGTLRVAAQTMPAPHVCGTPDPRNARALLDGLRIAVHGCLDGRFAGMVTAPLQKSAICDAGIPFTGHTEYLAELTGTKLPVMLLVGGNLRVALASTHMPLSEVPSYITGDRLTAVIDVLHHDLITRFGIADPEIVVLGLNPHAGEGGHLGHEDDTIIRPVVDAMHARGRRVRGPLPADTAFTPAGGHADAILAMYHDQGLPVLKYAGFGSAVNVTLGLPIVRTSVDHGTALGIAGTGRADAGSLKAAVDLALEMSAR